MSHEPHITPTSPEDLELTVAMHRRCSPHTLWSRYHRAMPDPRTCLPGLLGRPGSVHLAARDEAGRIIALGHLMPDRSAAEAALLVEDTWQDHGLGTRLLHRLGRHAVSGGWKTVYGLILPGDQRIAAVLRHTPVRVHSRDEGGAVKVWVRTRDLEAAAFARRPWPVPRRGAGHMSTRRTKAST